MFKVYYFVYFDFNIRKNNKYMLLFCKVWSLIVEGKVIESLYIFSCLRENVSLINICVYLNVVFFILDY